MAKAKAKKVMKREAESKEPEKGKVGQVEERDLMVLQVAVKDLEIVSLRLKLAQADVENLQRDRQRLTEQMQRLTRQANEKYNLVSGSDKLDLATGIITRG